MTTVVEMIGAGPGDPDLLTLRAEASLAAATVVVVDAAVAHLAAAFAPRATVSISAAGGGAAVDGDAIRILTGAARRDERVVRLYRGDPWLHPAYAVESGILASAGIAHVAVPGPSVELAAPGAVGLAVHHRPLAVTVTTAAPGALPPATDPARTLVTVTDDVTAVAAMLLRDGDPAMPAAVVRIGEGVTVAHRGTLASLADVHAAHSAGGPAPQSVDGPTVGNADGDGAGDGDGGGGDPTLGPGVVVVGGVAAP
jgi:siroheme synthase